MAETALVSDVVWAFHPTRAWVPAQQNPNRPTSFWTLDGEGFDCKEHPTRPVDTAYNTSVDDMVHLTELSDATILHNLRIRYETNIIYTKVGSIILSLNPYTSLASTGSALVETYRDEQGASPEARRAPPHVYSLAAQTLYQLEEENLDQSVVISGESGSGKTEATKIVVQYLAECATAAEGDDVTQQILMTNPVVEAFGNARTCNNDNSSRFGKWTEILFDPEYKTIFGCRLTSFLLEKSRAVHQAAGDCNFHVFYLLLGGSRTELKERLGLDTQQAYKILRPQAEVAVPSVVIGKFDTLCDSMDLLNFSPEQVDELWRGLAIMMHLGNMEFGTGDEATLATDELPLVARLWGCDIKSLQTALLSKTLTVGNANIMKPRTPQQAAGERDSLIKLLYARLFDKVLEKLNMELAKERSGNRFIGVLDVFGFEIMETNHFEQLCINYANEKLQKFFNNKVFFEAIQEYNSEGLLEIAVEFQDSTLACLDVIEKPSTGILAMIAEELRLPQGSDTALLQKMAKVHDKGKEGCYHAARTKGNTFTISHFAGEVTYVVDGFLAKNLDHVGLQATQIINETNFSSFHEVELVPNSSAIAPTKQRKKRTLGTLFRDNLNSLAHTLGNTQPQFLRCIKPNLTKQRCGGGARSAFDGQLVLRQLRYLGMQDVIRMRQNGYPIRRTFQNFCHRYRLLLPGNQVGDGEGADKCQRILQLINDQEAEYRIGKSLVFLKEAVVGV